MAIKTYFGSASNGARLPKKIYIGNPEDSAKKILKIYLGDKNGLSKLAYASTCNHNWQYITSWDPTYCTEEGEDYYRCSLCGEERYELNGIWGDTHLSYNSDSYEAENCLETSWGEEWCNSCGWSNSWTGDSGPHSYDLDSWTSGTDCLHVGEDTYVCSFCGDSYSVPNGNYGPHTPETTRQEPTCTEEGFVEVVCSTCMEQLSYETLPADPVGGHDYSEILSSEDATCTTNGYIEYGCTHCGNSRVESISAIGHNYIAGEPGKAGEITYTCSRCGDSYTDWGTT